MENADSFDDDLREKLITVKLSRKKCAPVRGWWGKRLVTQRTQARKIDYTEKQPKITDGGSSNIITVEDSGDDDDTLMQIQLLLLICWWKIDDSEDRLTMNEILAKREASTKWRNDPPQTTIADEIETEEESLEEEKEEEEQEEEANDSYDRDVSPEHERSSPTLMRMRYLCTNLILVMELIINMILGW